MERYVVKQIAPSDYSWTLREVRVRASLLMKAARSGDPAALSRLGAKPKRRTALNVIALEMTGRNYLDLRALMPRVEPDHRSSVADPARMFERHLAQFLNHWFANYEEALLHLEAAGGFLFPYKSQFVVVEADVLRNVGLDPDDPDWAAISWNWVKPSSTAAFARLSTVLINAGFEKSGGSDD
jgi:hypothetical protein